MKHFTKLILTALLTAALLPIAACSQVEETSSSNIRTGYAPGGAPESSAETTTESKTETTPESEEETTPESEEETTPESEEETTPESEAETTPESEESSQAEIPAGNADIQVTDGITYVNGIMIANKTYSLPESYDPGIIPEAYEALIKMEDAAAADGIVLFIMSGYRDYETQDVIYNRYVNDYGKAEADRFSARPGHSEHQTGYAFDLNSLDESFGDTAEGIWLAENCHKYGFIIRYPRGKEEITGYMYEPWHVRYLGKDISEKVYNSGLTLEEYLGITSAYSE